MNKNIKVLYINRVTVEYSSIPELQGDYHIIDTVDYPKVDKILVAPSLTGYYTYLKVFYNSAKTEWYKQISNTKDYKKIDIKENTKEFNTIVVDLLGEEKELIQLVVDNKDVRMYYTIKQKELNSLQNKIENMGYGYSYIEKLKKSNGATTVEDFIENLEEVIGNKKVS